MQTESKREPNVMGEQVFTGAQDVTQAGFLQETQVMDTEQESMSSLGSQCE